MLKNLIKTTLRSLLKNRAFTIINIVGLSFGLLIVFLISGITVKELSYDTFHDDKERVFRVSHKFYKNGELNYHGASTFPMVGPTLKNEYPEVENYCRLFKKYAPGVVKYEDKSFKEANLFYADSTFFDIFSYPLLSGNPNNVLKYPQTAIIEKSHAIKYFGEQDPIGKNISVGSADGIEEFEIVGVFYCPANSHLELDFIFSFESFANLHEEDLSSLWSWYDFYTYIKLNAFSKKDYLESQFPKFADKYGGEMRGSSVVGFELQPVESIHLNSNLIYEPSQNASMGRLKLTITVGLFILVLAWVNYINLSTAKSINRAKEVGIRKVLGSKKTALIMQFLLESFTINFIASLVAMLLALLLLPYFNEVTGITLIATDLLNTKVLLTFIIIWLGGSLLSGIYPALMISKTSPIKALELKSGSAKSAAIRRFLSSSQFFISAILVACTLVIISQINFMREENLGIDVQNNLVVRTPAEIDNISLYANNLDKFSNAMAELSRVTSTSISSEIPGKPVNWYGGARIISRDDTPENRTTNFLMSVNESYLNHYQNNIVAGRNFKANEDSQNIIINEKSASQFNFEIPDNAIGSSVVLGSDTLNIIGVIEDYHQEILSEPIKPIIYLFNRHGEHKFISVKYMSENEQQIIEKAEELHGQIFDGHPFEYFFLNDFIDQKFKPQTELLNTLIIFSFLTILIAVIGLIGLSAYTLESNRKSICVRKILGIPMSNLTLLLLNILLKNVIVGCLLAIPFIYYFSNKILNNYAYSIEFKWSNLFLMLVILLSISLMSVFVYVIRAWKIQPAEELRVE